MPSAIALIEHLSLLSVHCVNGGRKDRNRNMFCAKYFRTLKKQIVILYSFYFHKDLSMEREKI